MTDNPLQHYSLDELKALRKAVEVAETAKKATNGAQDERLEPGGSSGIQEIEKPSEDAPEPPAAPKIRIPSDPAFLDDPTYCPRRKLSPRPAELRGRSWGDIVCMKADGALSPQALKWLNERMNIPTDPPHRSKIDPKHLWLLR